MSTISCTAAKPAGCRDVIMNPAFFSVRSQTSGQLPCTDIIPEQLLEYVLPGTRPTVKYCPSGYILVQEIETAGLVLWHHTILLSEDDTFLVTCEQPILSLNFCLRNSFLLSRKESNEQLTFHEGQYNLSFFPKLDLIAEFRKDRAYCFVTISYPEDCLQKCAVSYTFLGNFLQRLDSGHESFLYLANQFVTKPMKKILSSLLLGDCAEEEIGLLIKKGKMLELLVKVIEQVPSSSSTASVRINVQDVEKIYEAREWLSQQVNRPVTLYELSRRVGMNVHKLSAGFQKIIGMTVFHFHRKIRMAKAVHLLESTDRDLFDIGTEVGYTDGKTFSKEFKKEKGIPPLEYRRQMKLQQHAEN